MSVTINNVLGEVVGAGDSAKYRYLRRGDHLPGVAEVEAAGFHAQLCRVRLYNPVGPGSWWIVAYDPDTATAWGVAQWGDDGFSVGEIDMVDVVEFRAREEVPVVRDLHFRPCSVAQVLQELVA